MDQLFKKEYAIIRGYAEEVAAECFSHGFEVDLKLSEYFVKSVLLNPEYELIEMGKIVRDYESEISILGIDFFSRRHSPELAALKIQSLFATEYENDDNIISEHNKLLFSYIEPLMQFVITFKVNNVEIDHPILYRKIIMLVGLLCGLGNPHRPKEYEELEAGINSVMNIQELSAFVTIPEDKKREQILKLSQIIVGIRLYNWKKGKGGPDIVDLPQLVGNSIEATQIRFNRFIEQYESKVNKLTDSLKNYYLWNPDIPQLMEFNNKLKQPYSNDKDIDKAKTVLLLFHQIVHFLRELTSNVSKMDSDLKNTTIDMENCLERIQKSIDIRSLIPVHIIYPQFYELSLYWNRFQNMITILTYYNRLVKKMDNIVKEIHEYLGEVILDVLNKPLPETPDSRESVQVIDPNTVYACDVLYPDEYECLIVPLEYNGFCPVYCCECNGLLYKADRFSGILKYKDKFYGFKDSNAASLFGADPEWYVTKVLDFCRRNMIYIDVLNMRSTIMKISLGLILLKLDDIPEINYNVGTQTELHPYVGIDKTYKCSIWQWKYDLGHYADMLYYRTHSTQTYNSIFRYSIWTQTFHKRDVGVQTMPDNYTQVPFISYFQYGTRGEPSFPQPHVIHLTRPVEEPPFDIIE
ncbi:hypothetical protein O3M35_012261 [Rhynocoris fuscipes]|uniref:Cilia- and flagella-associated protein 206 n=1 Tax=Rhynocoris fuscipes TaxID=488301 RepID=A0AAW1CXI9_9HEMI